MQIPTLKNSHKPFPIDFPPQPQHFNQHVPHRGTRIQRLLFALLCAGISNPADCRVTIESNALDEQFTAVNHGTIGTLCFHHSKMYACGLWYVYYCPQSPALPTAAKLLTAVSVPLNVKSPSASMTRRLLAPSAGEHSRLNTPRLVFCSGRINSTIPRATWRKWNRKKIQFFYYIFDSIRYATVFQ